MRWVVIAAGAWAFYALGVHNGGYKECRMQWSTVDQAPAVWEHCKRRFRIRNG